MRSKKKGSEPFFDCDRFSDPVEARKKAMDYLARREHGRTELLDKLVRFGFDETVADAAVTQLVAERLQSDARFVDAFIGSRISQGKGPLRIRAELLARGISDAMITQGLDDTQQDWYATACDVRRKKFGGDLPGDFADKAKQMRFLQSRGFDSEQIRAAVSARTE